MTFRATSLSEQILRVTESNDSGRWLRARWADALKDDLVGSGVDPTSVVVDARFGFDGSYGFGRQHWDLVVFDNDVPVAIIEIKTILSSVRKNLANRIEEIIAIATNLARVFDGPDRAAYKPCVAVIFAVDGTDAAGDIERVGEAFSRMLDDRLLDAACLLSVDRSKRVVTEPFENQNFDSFVSAMLRYIDDVTDQRGYGATGAASLGRAFAHSDDIEAVVSGLTSTREGLSAAEAAVIRERRRLVSYLRQLALDPGANETKMQASIEGKYWLFGGQYIGIAERRTFVPLDQYDVPLICADGSIEIVELKGPEAQLVRRHRKHLIVSNQVHEAVNQCLNYLRALDEVGAALQTHYRNELDLELDFRRARGTVIIGHPGRTSTAGVTKEQVDQTIRSYNAHLSRLTVRTYADVLDSAERSLRFASEGTAAGQADLDT